MDMLIIQKSPILLHKSYPDEPTKIKVYENSAV